MRAEALVHFICLVYQKRKREKHSLVGIFVSGIANEVL